MPYKDKEAQKKYQREWIKNKKQRLKKEDPEEYERILAARREDKKKYRQTPAGIANDLKWSKWRRKYKASKEYKEKERKRRWMREYGAYSPVAEIVYTLEKELRSVKKSNKTKLN